MSMFAVTYDYLCPFARNANEHVVAALRAGADWDVRFLPFSLTQAHVGEDEPPVWEREDPAEGSGVLALQAGLAVREDQPEHFLSAHLALFAARHDHGEDIQDPEVLRAALRSAEVDPDPVLKRVEAGDTLEWLRSEHREAADEHGVWGVPTFVGDDRAVFVRLLDRPDDGTDSRERIQEVLDLLAHRPALHEFKQVDLPV